MEAEEISDVYRPLQFDHEQNLETEKTFDSSLQQCEQVQDLDDLQLMGSPEEIAAEIVEKPAESSRGTSVGGKRKKGRKTRVQQKPQSKKQEEEDVCFICFDGGNLVLCDRRFCPKAYHPACVNRDEAFFKSRGRWNCGWHICSNCEKSAHYMCYTCTFSLCKGCIKEAGFFCVRGNKGFCETCMRTVMMIETNEEANKDMVQVDFDDKNNWEYLFKDYWVDLKGKLLLTLDELKGASNPWQGSGVQLRNDASSNELYDANDDQDSGSENSSDHLEVCTSKRKKAKNRSKPSKIVGSPVSCEGVPAPKDVEWASKELLEFVEHMKDGDMSVLSQFDVQALLLEYIKRNKLRDPRKKSQIICDSRLENLFGKARVGHFEMLKLLESHFLIKEALPQALGDDPQDGTIDTEGDHMEVEGDRDLMPKRRKGRKKVEEKMQQTNLDDYAAIDVHNINLIYLRRNLVEDLLEDLNKFQDRLVGSFVRIRISVVGCKQDMYRLVQVVGTGKAAEPYKTGKKTTHILLEILNLNKTESITVDSISNQEFTEEECNRLRQSIKCGFISRLTVGEIQDKAMSLQAVKVNDFLETEILRLSHLRDRASEKGRRKEECVEKLKLLGTPEERVRRLEELPEVHSDPHMDPSYESDENDGDKDEKKQNYYSNSRDSGFIKRGKDPFSPGARKASNSTWEPGRKSGAWDKGEGAAAGSSRERNSVGNDTSSDRTNKTSWNQGRERQGDENPLSGWETPKNQAGTTGLGSDVWNTQGGGSACSASDWSAGPSKSGSTPSTMRPGQLPSVATETAPTPPNNREAEKMWHYQDPSGKVQGPFSMTQLRKWSTTGYFPSNLRIWKTTEKQEDSLLLRDALVGKFEKEPSIWDPQPSSFSQAQRGARPDNRDSGWGGAQDGNHNSTWKESQQTDGASLNSNWKDSSGPANGVVELAKTDGWDSSRSGNAWSSQSQGHSPRPGFFRASSHQGREGRGGGSGGTWNSGQNSGNTWNPTRPAASSNWGSSGQSSGEDWRAQPENTSKDWASPPSVTIPMEGWGSDQRARNDSSNLLTPTTPPVGRGWTGGQGSEIKWSGASPVSLQPPTPAPGPRNSWGPQTSTTTQESGKVSVCWGEQAPAKASAWPQPSGSWPQRATDAGENPRTSELGSSSASTAPAGLAADSAVAANSQPTTLLMPSQLVPVPAGKDVIIAGDNQMPSPSAPSRTPSETKGGWDTSNDQVSSIQGPSPKPASFGLDWSVVSAVSAEPSVAKDQVQGLDPGPGLESQGWGFSGQKVETSGLSPEHVLKSEGWEPASTRKPDLVDSSSKSAHDSQGWGVTPAGIGPEPVSAKKPEGAATDSWEVASANATQSNFQTNSSAGQDPASSNKPWKTSPSVEPSAPASSGWGSAAQDTNTGWEAKQGTATSTGWGVATGDSKDSQSGWGAPAGDLKDSKIGWGAGSGNANTGLGTGSANVNVGWGSALGNANMGRGATGGDSSTGWGIGPGNASVGRGGGSGDTNSGWGSGSGNSNSGWAIQQRHDGEGFSHQGDRGFPGGDSGHGGRPWNNNRHSGGGSGGGGGGPRGPRGQRVCKFHESGFCKKGASCNFLHP